VGLGCLLYTYKPSEIADLGLGYFDDDNIRHIKMRIARELMRRFSTSSAGVVPAKSRAILTTPADTHDQVLVRQALKAFTPWHSLHIPPAAPGSSILETLFHENAAASDWDRKHALIDPQCAGLEHLINEYNTYFFTTFRPKLADPIAKLVVPSFEGPPTTPLHRFNPRVLTETEKILINERHEPSGAWAFDLDTLYLYLRDLLLTDDPLDETSTRRARSDARCGRHPLEELPDLCSDLGGAVRLLSGIQRKVVSIAARDLPVRAEHADCGSAENRYDGYDGCVEACLEAGNQHVDFGTAPVTDSVEPRDDIRNIIAVPAQMDGAILMLGRKGTPIPDPRDGVLPSALVLTANQNVHVNGDNFQSDLPVDAFNSNDQVNNPDGLDDPLREEFESVALRHKIALGRAALRLCVGIDMCAEDLIQETYFQAWKSFRRLGQRTDIRAWLFKILFNLVRHHHRKLSECSWSSADSETPADESYELQDPNEDICAAFGRTPEQAIDPPGDDKPGAGQDSGELGMPVAKASEFTPRKLRVFVLVGAFGGFGSSALESLLRRLHHRDCEGGDSKESSSHDIAHSGVLSIDPNLDERELTIQYPFFRTSVRTPGFEAALFEHLVSLRSSDVRVIDLQGFQFRAAGRQKYPATASPATAIPFLQTWSPDGLHRATVIAAFERPGAGISSNECRGAANDNESEAITTEKGATNISPIHSVLRYRWEILCYTKTALLDRTVPVMLVITDGREDCNSPTTDFSRSATLNWQTIFECVDGQPVAESENQKMRNAGDAVDAPVNVNLGTTGGSESVLGGFAWVCTAGRNDLFLNPDDTGTVWVPELADSTRFSQVTLLADWDGREPHFASTAALDSPRTAPAREDPNLKHVRSMMATGQCWTLISKQIGKPSSAPSSSLTRWDSEHVLRSLIGFQFSVHRKPSIYGFSVRSAPGGSRIEIPGQTRSDPSMEVALPGFYHTRRTDGNPVSAVTNSLARLYEHALEHRSPGVII
jgi:hypothetical protein